MTVWYTCTHCAPHGMADHSMYGDRQCLIQDCPCPGYKADPGKPIQPREKKPSPPVRFRPKT